MIASHQQIVSALVAIAPNAQWTLEGEEFDSSLPIEIDWIDTVQERPTDQAIFAEVENQLRSI